MGADFKGWLIAVALIFLAISLKGCATQKNIPIIKSGDLAKIPVEVVRPAKRPPARTPANTPILEAGKQWAADRRGWGDEADRGDTVRRILCAERGWKILDKQNHNVCDQLTR